AFGWLADSFDSTPVDHALGCLQTDVTGGPVLLNSAFGAGGPFGQLPWGSGRYDKSMSPANNHEGRDGGMKRASIVSTAGIVLVGSAVGLYAAEGEAFTGVAAASGTHERPLSLVDGKRYELKASDKADTAVAKTLAKAIPRTGASAGGVAFPARALLAVGDDV